jgi:antitoxin component YwqK of YwqJK toxin-antitoxin module
MARIFIVLIFLLTAQTVFAQVEGDEELRFTVDTPVTLDFGEPEEEAPKKKKKVKKKVFYGVKTKKGFTRKGFGDRTVYEVFYFLKKSETPQTFARDIYFYDYARKEIRKSNKFDPTKGVLLHGPYEKRQGSTVLEKGIYFKGTKHGRWMTYSRDSVLVNKAKYYKGWPKESQVTYYDPTERKKMKEMIPIEYGEREGYYYYFHENGQLAIQGEYHWDRKVGDWTEYYPSGRRKRIIAYPSDKNVFDNGAIREKKFIETRRWLL